MQSSLPAILSHSVCYSTSQTMVDCFTKFECLLDSTYDNVKLLHCFMCRLLTCEQFKLIWWREKKKKSSQCVTVAGCLCTLLTNCMGECNCWVNSTACEVYCCIVHPRNSGSRWISWIDRKRAHLEREGETGKRLNGRAQYSTCNGGRNLVACDGFIATGWVESPRDEWIKWNDVSEQSTWKVHLYLMVCVVIRNQSMMVSSTE